MLPSRERHRHGDPEELSLFDVDRLEAGQNGGRLPAGEQAAEVRNVGADAGPVPPLPFADRQLRKAEVLAEAGLIRVLLTPLPP